MTTLARFFRSNKLFAISVIVGASTFISHAQTLVLTNIWSIAPNSRPYVTSGQTERGIAISPVDGNVFIVSRAPAIGGLGVYVLDGETGAELTNGLGGPLTLSTNNIFGGTFLLNAIGVADDGVIYACNLGPSSLKIYRWADVNSDPTVAFGAATISGQTRLGDTMDVRGSGVDTQIIVSGVGNAGFVVLTTTDGLTFTPTGFSLPSGTSAGDFGKGIAFGAANDLFGKRDTIPTIRRATFDLATPSTTWTGDINVENSMGPIDADMTRNILGGLLVGGAGDGNNHKLKFYEISNPSAPQAMGVFPLPSSSFNGSLVGAVDCGTNKFVALDTANGVIAIRIDISFAPIPPTITVQPQSQTVLSGGFVTFSADAEGALPLSFQWYSNSIPIFNATNKSVLIKPAYTNSAGSYWVVVTNAGGTATSDIATLTIIPSESTDFASEVWSLGAGSRPYLTSTTRQRGMAYNPATDSLMVASGSVIGGPPLIYVLNAATGADKHQLDMTDVVGGYFPILSIAAAEDGVVYAMNMTLRGEAMKLYRWENDSPTTAPTVAYGPGNVWGTDAEGNPIIDNSNRLGDTMNIRGRGTNTQIICTANGYTKAVIFTTTDGLNFTPTPIVVTNAPVDQYQIRLGVAFGLGDTFWAKGLKDEANGRTEDAPLRNIAFNLASGTGEIVHTYSTARDTMSAIGVEVNNDILAGLNFGTPDSIKVFDISDLTAEPPVMDQDFYATDNANQFFTGAFDSGGGRLYSLNTGNGLLCLKIKEVLPGITKQPISLTNAAGSRAIFSVKSTGYPRYSRWQHNAVDLAGATTSTLTIHSCRGTNAGNYRLIITNSLGSITSAIVNLRITAGILTHPVSQILNPGDPLNLSVAADGEPPLTYQWRLNGTNIPGATTTSISIASVQPEQGGEYSAVVTGPLNTVTSGTAMIHVLQNSTPGDGTGLLGDYWTDDAGRNLAGPPTFSRQDLQINYNWGTASPENSISVDNYSARWTGQVQPLYSQEYTFYANTDDGVRLWVNGQQLINRWTVGSTESSGRISLAANQKYNLVMEYFEFQDTSFAELRWSSVSQLKDLIPTSQLYPTVGVTPVPLTAARNNSDLVLSWPSGFRLQSSTNAAGPFQDVSGAVSPFTNNINSPSQKFFRLISD